MAEGGSTCMSHALNTLLDSLGLDEDLRQRRIRCQKILQWVCTRNQALLKMEDACICWMLQSGSNYETTTIDGLSSDIDIMLIPNIRAIDDIKDWKGDGVPTYMVDSSECYKSFVRLYVLSSVYPGPEYRDIDTCISSVRPLQQVDTGGRVLLINDVTNMLNFPSDMSDRSLEQHGPAMSIPELPDYPETDFVLALRCESFPRYAVGWKTRQTPLTRTRISPAIIDEINHCYLVGVGNKASATPHLEWRLSFSHIENELIHNWNNTQYKCYVMMTFIQKDLIKPQVPEALCSYHLKTILMWMNEEYPSEFFIEANFEKCLSSFLNNLADAVRRKSLPHYFVDGCNLFYPKITSDSVLTQNLSTTIQDIIASWPYCLCNITRCYLGKMITEYLANSASLTRICLSVHQIRRCIGHRYESIQEYSTIIDMIATLWYRIMNSNKHSKDKIMFLLDLKQRSLQQSNSDIKQFINIFVNDSLCGLGIDLTIQSRSMTNKNALKSFKLGLCLAQRYFKYCRIVTRLRLAADFTGKYQGALTILDRVENQIKPYTQLLCSHEQCFSYNQSSVRKMVYDNKPSLVEYYNQYCIGVVTYKRSQMSHVPKGLVYEMFRSTAVSPVSDPELYHWYAEAVIHCPVYLYYLRFLYHQRQGQNTHRQVVIDNMNWATEEISIVPGTHEETNHNIIGHCHRTVGDTRCAYKEYRKSLGKKKYNNAVIWHLAVLLREKIRGDH